MSLLRRRLMSEYIRDDADEELDYFTVIPFVYSEEHRDAEYELYMYGYGIYDSTHLLYYSDIYYSLNGGEWTLCELDVPLKVRHLDRVRLKCNGYELKEEWETVSGYNPYTAQVYMEKSMCMFMVDGTPLSLLHGDKFKEKKNDLMIGCFYRMFAGNTQFIQINNPRTFLPSTELTESCYVEMFAGCYTLNCPALPTETLAPYCYTSMFAGANFIEDAHEIGAITLAPYSCNSMFYGCASLSYIKFTPRENLDAEEALYYIFDNICPYGVMVLSNELLEAPPVMPGWFITSEDYPIDKNGFPSTEVFDDTTTAICLNTELVEVSEDYLAYRKRETDSVSKVMYDVLWIEEDVGKEYNWSQSGFYVDRKVINSLYIGEDFVSMKATIPNTGEMNVVLWSDGLIECWRTDYIIRL